MFHMARVFVVEDDFHAEWMGQFPTNEEALDYLANLRADPTSVENRPPCENWKNCSREYYLIEYDDDVEPWVAIRSEPVFEVRAGVVQPITRTSPPHNTQSNRDPSKR